MRTLQQVFESVVKSYNNKEKLNFMDVRDLDELLSDRRLFDSFVKTFNEDELINFIQLRGLENSI